MSQSTVLALSLLMISSLPLVGSLLCYQCGTTAESHECMDDYGGFVNTSRGLTDKYAKNCTAANANWTRCMILTAHGQNGLQALFHRGCHDGESFTKLYENHRFMGLAANNQTTCARITLSREFVCFTFCDTDFCNGPQAPPLPVDPCSAINFNASDSGGLVCGSNGSGPRKQGTITLSGFLMISALVFFSGMSW